MEITETVNGKYTNKNIDFKTMKLNETAELKIVKQFWSKDYEKEGSHWTSRGFEFEYNGEKVSAFAPNTFLGDKMFELVGKTIKLTKLFDEKKNKGYFEFEVVGDNGGNSPSVSSNFEFKNLIVDGNEEPETEAVKAIKTEGNFDNEARYIEVFKVYGSTEERAKLVFANRNLVK